MEKNYIKEQNDRIVDLTEEVQNLKLDNYALVEELKRQVALTEQNLKAVLENERDFKKELTSDVSYIARSSALQIKGEAKSAIDEAVKQGKWEVKNLYEDSEEKIRDLMQRLHWLREKTDLRSGFQKFFFWASPILMLIQTIMLVFALWL